MKQSSLIFSALSAISLFIIGRMLLNGIASIAVPFGYLLYFLLFLGFTYCLIKKLAKANGMTMSDCYLSRPFITRTGAAAAVFFPIFIFLWESWGAAGTWHVNKSVSFSLLTALFHAFFYSGLSSGVGEEMLFRGYLTGLCVKLKRPLDPYILPGILFALGHLPQLLHQTSPLLFALQFFQYLSLSFFLTSLTLKSRSIWDAALFHASWNLFVAGNSVISTEITPNPNAIFTYVLEGEPIFLFSQEINFLIISSILLFGTFITCQSRSL
mgnify:CR=1 FL=1